MQIEKCPVCEYQFKVVRTYVDPELITESGERCTVCSNCGATVVTNKEVELNEYQQERCDNIYKTAHELCKILADNDDLVYDQSYIGDLVELAAKTLLRRGVEKIRYPGVITNQDGSQYIEEYYYPDDDGDNKPKTDGSMPTECSTEDPFVIAKLISTETNCVADVYTSENAIDEFVKDRKDKDTLLFIPYRKCGNFKRFH